MERIIEVGNGLFIVLSALYFVFTDNGGLSYISLDDVPQGFCFVTDTLGTDPWHGYVFVLTLKRGANATQLAFQTYYQEAQIRYKESGVWGTWKNI